MTFIDTNVFVYLIDDRNLAKQKSARDIVVDAMGRTDRMISVQVLNEFANVSVKKLGLSIDEVRQYIRSFQGIVTVGLDSALTDRALEIQEKYGLQFYDSLLLATAEANGCDEFISEDLNDGQLYCGMRVVNPFKEGAGGTPTFKW